MRSCLCWRRAWHHEQLLRPAGVQQSHTLSICDRNWFLQHIQPAQRPVYHCSVFCVSLWNTEWKVGMSLKQSAQLDRLHRTTHAAALNQYNICRCMDGCSEHGRQYVFVQKHTADTHSLSEPEDGRKCAGGCCVISPDWSPERPATPYSTRISSRPVSCRPTAVQLEVSLRPTDDILHP